MRIYRKFLIIFSIKVLSSFTYDIANGTFNLKRIKRVFRSSTRLLKTNQKIVLLNIEIDRSKLDKKTSDEKSKLIEFQGNRDDIFNIHYQNVVSQSQVMRFSVLYQ